MQSTYTGVYGRGGPTNVDRPKDLAGIANRKPADSRGVALPFRRASDAAATPRGRPLDSARAARTDVSPTASVRSGALMSRASSMMGGPEPRTARARPSFGGGAATLSFMSEPRSGRGRPSIGGGLAASEHIAGYENLRAAPPPCSCTPVCMRR